jgi:hypothetical protein
MLFGMALRKMLYIACNQCGVPAGGGDDMCDDARAALDRSRQLGFRRVKRSGRMIDLCRPCYGKSES